MPARNYPRRGRRANTEESRLNQAANVSFPKDGVDFSKMELPTVESTAEIAERFIERGTVMFGGFPEGDEMSENTPTTDDETSARATVSRRRVLRRVGDVTESSLWPDLPRSEMEDLLDVDIEIHDARFLKSSKYPRPDGSPGEYAVIKCANAENGAEFTTANGGGVVLQKLHELHDKKAFPVLGKFTEVVPAAGGRAYYDLL